MLMLMLILSLSKKKITTIDNLATDEKSSLGFCQLSVPELLHDERLLRQVFAVLVTAHYQTKPSDLQLLLDNAQVRLFCIYHLLANNEKQILAVALIMNEGQRSSDDVLAVKNSTQRLRNEFIPQSLLTHCGIEQAFDFSYFRIMRIAVHPQCQQRGIGSFLLNKIESYAIQNKIDFIGASFGANEQLLKFWLLGDYQLARIGFSQDASSGEHSALVLKSLNKETAPVLKDIQYQFYRTFDYLLVDEYKHLSNSMVWLILHACPAIYLPKLSLVDINNINAFTNKERLFSSCVYSLHLWLLHHMTREFHLDVLPLISRVFKKNSIEDVCKQYQLSGKKSLNQLMINYLKDNI